MMSMEEIVEQDPRCPDMGDSFWIFYRDVDVEIDQIEDIDPDTITEMINGVRDMSHLANRDYILHKLREWRDEARKHSLEEALESYHEHYDHDWAPKSDQPDKEIENEWISLVNQGEVEESLAAERGWKDKANERDRQYALCAES